MNDADLMVGNEPIFGVTDALAVLNQVFETATPNIIIVGEVANFKINQNKWVFFDIKDEESSMGCFMSVFNLHTVIEDGMKVRIRARPGLTRWGKFSLTIQDIQPVGTGSIKRAFNLLKDKLEKEGLFDDERKRPLPYLPSRIGVISSVQAAGYIDFIRILGQRMGGIEIEVANVQVQGDVAAGQVVSALQHFNGQAEPPEIIALIRGGGSRDDLAAFDDERLVRALASSRTPTITGIGHEIDTTLADLAADCRAATPSNAAQILVPDKNALMSNVDLRLRQVLNDYSNQLNREINNVNDRLAFASSRAEQIISSAQERLKNLNQILRQVDPRLVLNRGYSIVRDEMGKIIRQRPNLGDKLIIENSKMIIETEVKNVRDK